MVEKVANSNFLLPKQNCFVEQVSCMQIFTASENFYFDQQKLLFGLIVFSQKRDMDCDKKLNSISRRHYDLIMTLSLHDSAQYGIYFLPTSRHYEAIMPSQNQIQFILIPSGWVWIILENPPHSMV